MDLVKRMEEYRERGRALAWEGTFAQYFEIATRQPSVAQLSHARIYDMIMAAGTETGPPGRDPAQVLRRRDLRHREAAPAARRVLPLRRAAAGGAQAHPAADGPGRRRQVDHRHAAQARPGGVHAAPTTGAVYAIKGCPMHEEPLHLIPEELRAEVRAGVRHLHRGRPLPALPLRCWRTSTTASIEDVPVERIVFSRRTACGIGTFTPSDPKIQDISELIGGIDLSTIGESASRATRAPTASTAS